MTQEELRAAIDVWRENGESVTKAAKALSIPRNTMDSRVRKAKLAGLHVSEGVRDSVDRAGLGYVEARGGHRRVYDDDGKQIDTVRYTIPQEELTQGYLDRMAAAFDTIVPAAPVPKTGDTFADLCNVLPLYDVHWGMAAWGKETGDQDYDLTLARDDLMRGLDRILTTAPRADTCVLILGGDFLHADDDSAQTPASKHPLDVASKQFMAIDTGIAIIKYAVARVLEHHDKVVIRVLRGNHDPNSHRTIAFSLREWLLENPRATVDMDPRELFMFQWGRASIFGQHGDQMKPVDLALKLADVCPFWTAATHRYAYTGHKHSMAAARIGGLNWERLEPFAPSDVYGASWVNRRAMKLDTYHTARGRIGTVMDPLERE